MSVINDYYRDDFRHWRKDVRSSCRIALLLINALQNFRNLTGSSARNANSADAGKSMLLLNRKATSFIFLQVSVSQKDLPGGKISRELSGASCDYEIERGISSEKIRALVLRLQAAASKHRAYVSMYDCVNNDVDWDKIIELM
jgi:hypothetical protein